MPKQFYIINIFYFNFSNNREIRNRAEKMRRDKLNSFINELATLVPMVSRSPKRMDKTTVLRLAAAFLRLHQRKFLYKCTISIYLTYKFGITCLLALDIILSYHIASM